MRLRKFFFLFIFCSLGHFVFADSADVHLIGKIENLESRLREAEKKVYGLEKQIEGIEKADSRVEKIAGAIVGLLVVLVGFNIYNSNKAARDTAREVADEEMKDVKVSLKQLVRETQSELKELQIAGKENIDESKN